MLKLHKNFECSCLDGFTGDFCEFKIEQDQLLFVWKYTSSVFDADGRLIAESTLTDGLSGAFNSCSVMVNGEAIIFGGWDVNTNRQVRFIN